MPFPHDFSHAYACAYLTSGKNQAKNATVFWETFDLNISLFAFSLLENITARADFILGLTFAYFSWTRELKAMECAHPNYHTYTNRLRCSSWKHNSTSDGHGLEERLERFTS